MYLMIINNRIVMIDDNVIVVLQDLSPISVAKETKDRETRRMRGREKENQGNKRDDNEKREKSKGRRARERSLTENISEM